MSLLADGHWCRLVFYFARFVRRAKKKKRKNRRNRTEEDERKKKRVETVTTSAATFSHSIRLSNITSTFYHLTKQIQGRQKQIFFLFFFLKEKEKKEKHLNHKI